MITYDVWTLIKYEIYLFYTIKNKTIFTLIILIKYFYSSGDVDFLFTYLEK